MNWPDFTADISAGLHASQETQCGMRTSIFLHTQSRDVNEARTPRSRPRPQPTRPIEAEATTHEAESEATTHEAEAKRFLLLLSN